MSRTTVDPPSVDRQIRANKVDAKNVGDNAIQIRQASSEGDLGHVCALFTAYTKSLDIDLAFQSYAAEFSSLPGAYAAPKGSLLLAIAADGTPLGCMGVRSCPYDNPEGNVCEAKRLYVAPDGRGKGVGRALIETGISAAVSAGYTEMRLDTLASMESAQALYKKLGFSEIPPYYHNPNEGTIFMSRRLT